MNETTSSSGVIHFVCQQCHKELQIPASQANSTVACPACQHVQSSPAASSADSSGTTTSNLLDKPTQPASDDAGTEPSASITTNLTLDSVHALSSEQETPTKALFDRITEQIGKLYVGQDELVIGTLISLFSSGHVLIESVPGLGKTLFVP